jgi:GT2 family glycosyltransferase
MDLFLEFYRSIFLIKEDIFKNIRVIILSFFLIDLLTMRKVLLFHSGHSSVNSFLHGTSIHHINKSLSFYLLM